MSYLENNIHEIITWLGIFLLLLAGFIVLFPLLRQFIKRASVLRNIKNIGCDALSDVLVPDGLGGSAYIEFVIRFRDRFCIFLLKKYQGVVFAADHIDSWTQVVKNRTYKFPNPLPELDTYLMAVKSIVADVPVEGYLIALDGVDFPKGRPERLLPIATMKESFPDEFRQNPILYEKEWQKLVSVTKPAESKVNTFSSGFALNDFGWKRVILAITFFLLILPWVYLRIMV